MSKKNIALEIINHVDKDEILSKLLSGVDISDINEWLIATYCNPGEEKFHLSKKTLTTFKNDYLDFYTVISEDLAKTKENKHLVEDQLRLVIQGTPTYKKALEKYLDSEIDIKTVVKRVLASIEVRIEQIYDEVMLDSSNIKLDRTLIDWFNTLISLMEKYDKIQNGSIENINIQNNINIQVLDDHINVIYKIIKEILTKLDYDTSLVFIDMFNEEMQKVKPQEKEIFPLETRVAEAKIISETISNKLNE